MNDRILGPRLIMYAYQSFRNIGTNHKGGQNVMKQKTQKIIFLSWISIFRMTKSIRIKLLTADAYFSKKETLSAIMCILC